MASFFSFGFDFACSSGSSSNMATQTVNDSLDLETERISKRYGAPHQTLDAKTRLMLLASLASSKHSKSHAHAQNKTKEHREVGST